MDFPRPVFEREKPRRDGQNGPDGVIRSCSMRALQGVVIAGFAMLTIGCPGFGDEGATDVPENPTYSVEVKPILDAHCATCHTVPPANGAPDYMRLDQYEDSNGGTVFGAGSMCCAAKFRAVDGIPAVMPPPPNPRLNPTESEIVRRWADQGCRNFPTEPIGSPCD